MFHFLLSLVVVWIMSRDQFDEYFDEYKAKKLAKKSKKLSLIKPINEIPTWDKVKSLYKDDICIIC
ncbi:MAG: hypothetical protein HeimC2_30870 [Candidatus Heimdallarchaeota archaeon LC_2]|nr:MAG: hypothetical protein HeimC2_30870 [Candidatus Heimdallarchaeota archaeon LC_2]